MDRNLNPPSENYSMKVKVGRELVVLSASWNKLPPLPILSQYCTMELLLLNYNYSSYHSRYNLNGLYSTID